MANPYYNHNSGVPANLTRGTSDLMRQEFDAIGVGFDDVYAEITTLAAAIGVAVNVAEVDVASASTTDIGNGHGPVVRITGTTTINSFGAHYTQAIFLRFSGALILTQSASLVLPGGANITTVAGDACIAVPIGSPANGWRVVAYCRMSLGLVDDVAVRTSSTYADPGWLTSVAWSKITGTPTTLAGYGITDAPTKTGTGASGSWGINITGNAATATAIQNLSAFAAQRLASDQTAGNVAIFDFVPKQVGGSNYNNGTGVFTAPVAGWYMFSASLYIQNTSGAAAQGLIQISTNSAASGATGYSIAAGTTSACNCSCITYMNAGQIAEVYSPTAFNATFVLKTNVSTFQGIYLGA